MHGAAGNMKSKASTVCSTDNLLVAGSNIKRIAPSLLLLNTQSALLQPGNF